MSALAEARRELREQAEPERVPQLQRFFKTGPGEYGEGDVLIGARVPAIRLLARRFAAQLTPAEVLALLHSRVHEERLLALLVLVRRYERGEEAERRRIYDLYLANTDRVNNWDLVDASAPQIVGAQLLRRSRAPLEHLARSDSLWERRIAVLATFTFIRAGEFDCTLRLALVLIDDPHDLIHKAVGWMLREVGKRDEPLLREFLRRHGAEMPATMRRYASERLASG